MKQWKRHVIQAVATLIQNPHLGNFFKGTIDQGGTKHVCVPGLNCYSCPGAAFACPIGSLQSAIGGREKSFPYYVVGTILLLGVVLGRLICGFLCPFGLIQELLHKIPTPKPKIPKVVDRPLRWVKYAVLALTLLLGALVRDAFGLGTPYFCKYLCPAGTLEGGLALYISNEAIRGAVGFLFSWKMGVLAAVIVGSILLYRPFCKYLCPLGAIYGLLNRWSVYQMDVDQNACTRCGRCESACKMGVKVTEHINSAECIRCGACREACPTNAIHAGFFGAGKKRGAAAAASEGKSGEEALIK